MGIYGIKLKNPNDCIKILIKNLKLNKQKNQLNE